MKTEFDEIIFKYLSELLSDSEKSKFEIQIKDNPKMRERFEEISSKMNEINSLMPDDIESNYFSGLTPRVREKLSAQQTGKSLLSLKKAAAFGLAAVSAFVISLLTLDWDSNGEVNFRVSVDEAVAYSGSNEFNDFVELRSFTEEEIRYINDVELDNYSEILGDQIVSEDLTKADYGGYSYIGIEAIPELSDEESEEIYSYLINKKIL